MTKTPHWTEQSSGDYLFAVGFDFVEQLQDAMGGLNQKALAERLGVSEGRVSQVFNNPGNLTLSLMIEWSRHIGRKVGVVLYDDEDPKNLLGPVESEVFAHCWEAQGQPRNRGDLEVQKVYTVRVVMGGQAGRSQLKARVVERCDEDEQHQDMDESLQSMAG